MGIDDLFEFDKIDGYSVTEFLKSIEELLPQYIKNVKKRVNNITNILNSVRYITPFENETNQEFFEENKKEIKRILGKEYEKTNTIDDTIFKYITKIQKQYIKELS